jgi:hypothetical protein
MIKVIYYAERINGTAKYFKENREHNRLIAKIEISKWEYDRMKG